MIKKERFLSFLLCYTLNHMVWYETKKYSSMLKEISVSKQSLVKSQRYFMTTNTNSKCECHYKLINTELETLNNRMMKME